MPEIKFDINDIIVKLDDFIARAKSGIVKSRQVTFRNEIGISKTRLFELAKENEILANSLEKLNDLEEEHLIEGGETGTIPAPFAKFRLMQKPFNYSEKTETENKNTNENTNTTTFTDETLKLIERVAKRVGESD